MATGSDKITGGIVIIGGIGIMALLAGTSEGVGSLMVVIMVGFLIGWLLVGTGQPNLASWVSKINFNSGPKTVIV